MHKHVETKFIDAHALQLNAKWIIIHLSHKEKITLLPLSFSKLLEFENFLLPESSDCWKKMSILRYLLINNARVIVKLAILLANQATMASKTVR